MATPVYLDVTRRHDFVYLVDVTDGSPNGDPDANNMPRIDPETMQGLITDVALKRRVRNWIDIAKGTEARYKIYIQAGGEALNTIHQRAYTSQNLTSTGSKQNQSDVQRARQWMVENFYDVRTFGAVMTTGVNCGQVRGPVQMTFGRSIDRITPLDLAITRVAVTREEDRKVEVEEESGRGVGGKQSEMGRKSILPYALYRIHGFVNPHYARQSGFDEEDLRLFWKALLGMWDLDRSAARGMMACQGLWVFSHESSLGNASADKLFARVHVPSLGPEAHPRAFADYRVEVDGTNLPTGVTLTRLDASDS